MAPTLNTAGQLAGAHFWEFIDQNSWHNLTGAQGVVDRFTAPKVCYWFFRNKWTGLAPDYPRPGTATQLVLTADTNSLPADSVNVFLLIATMRDAAGHQISSDSGQVQFTLNDPTKGRIFGGNLVKAYGGKSAAFMRTTRSAGTFTLTATYPAISSIPAQTVTLTTTAVPAETYTDQVTAVRPRSSLPGRLNLEVVSGASSFKFRCPATAGTLKIVDIRGRTVWADAVARNASVAIARKIFGAGLFYAVWTSGSQRIIKPLSNGY